MTPDRAVLACVRRKRQARDSCTHRFGVPQMPPGATVKMMCDWDWMIRNIEQMEPMFEPDSQSTYQAFVFD